MQSILAIIGSTAGLSGSLLVAATFTATRDTLLTIGLALLIGAEVVGVFIMVARRLAALDDAFNHGYRVGMRKGQRAKLVALRGGR